MLAAGIAYSWSSSIEARFEMRNDPHHGAAGVDVDFTICWPPPLPCMRWFVDILRKFEDDAILGFFSAGAVILQYGTNNVEECFAFTVASMYQIITYVVHIRWMASHKFPLDEPNCFIVSKSFA